MVCERIDISSVQVTRYLSGGGKVIGPAFLLRPKLLVVSSSVDLQLDLVRVDNLLAAVLALDVTC